MVDSLVNVHRVELVVDDDAAVVGVLLRRSNLLGHWVVIRFDCTQQRGTYMAYSVHLDLRNVKLFQDLVVRLDAALPLFHALTCLHVLEIHAENVWNTTLDQTGCHKATCVLNDQNATEGVNVCVV